MLKLSKNLLTVPTGTMYYWVGVRTEIFQEGEIDFTGMYYPVM